MKILILTNHAPSLYNFRKELINKLLVNNEIIISMPEDDYFDYFNQIGCKMINTELIRRSINPINDIKLFINYNKIIRKIKPELIITYTIKPNIYGGLCARLYKIKYAANIAGLGSTFYNSRILKTIATALYRIGLKNSSVVFFENIENKNIFITNKIVKPLQCVLLNGAGINLNEYYPLKYSQSKTTNFLFVARIMKEKGIDELIEASKMLITNGYNIQLNILGSYEEDYSSKFTELSKQNWFKYHGYQKDTLPFIKDCHCFVLPSWHEGMANTNLEAAACARPIITSNIHGCKEAVIDGISGFLCERQNVESLYIAMKKFIELPFSDKLAMGLESRKHIENNFDKNIVVNNTIEALKM